MAFFLSIPVCHKYTAQLPQVLEILRSDLSVHPSLPKMSYEGETPIFWKGNKRVWRKKKAKQTIKISYEAGKKRVCRKKKKQEKNTK